MLPHVGEWKDLRTWDIFTEEMGEHLIGSGMIDFAARNVQVVNELGIPVTVLGLSDIVVAAGPDGIGVYRGPNGKRAYRRRYYSLMHDME